MTQEGQRHAAELKRLEDKKKDLEDALICLARDEAAAQEVAELAQEVEQLEQHVETARAAAKRADTPIEEKTMTKNEPANSPVEVRKAAARNRQAAERQLDELAKQMQQPGETFHKAYDRALQTDMGQALMRSRDDAQELERGGVTSMHLAEARKNLMG
jgi:predicted  nucleic acid-binding Zn-ribbon protein